MAKAKPLSARQFAVIDDLFKDEPKDTQILEKHNISRRLYDKWLADESFSDYLDRRKAWEHRHNEIILIKSERQAISNLMDLTKSQQAETARKACFDIITMGSSLSASSDTKPGKNPKPTPESPNLPPETAGKLLAVLAEKKPSRTS
jgi:hypothetical protein